MALMHKPENKQYKYIIIIIIIISLFDSVSDVGNMIHYLSPPFIFWSKQNQALMSHHVLMMECSCVQSGVA